MGEAYWRTVGLSRIHSNLAACEIVGRGGAMYRSLGTARQSQGATVGTQQGGEEGETSNLKNKHR